MNTELYKVLEYNLQFGENKVNLKDVLNNNLNIYKFIFCSVCWLYLLFVLFWCPLIVQNNEDHYDIFIHMYNDQVLPIYFYFFKTVYKFIIWK